MLLSPCAAASGADGIEHKRRRVCSTSDFYLDELNQKGVSGDWEFDIGVLDHCPTAPRADAAVKPKSQSQSRNSYLDLLNNRQNSNWTECLPGDISASGEGLPTGPRQTDADQPATISSYYGLELQGRLGSGSFGSVFGCIWQSKRLAVKMYHGARTLHVVHSAERELKLLKHLSKSPRSTFICNLQAWRKKGGQYLFF